MKMRSGQSPPILITNEMASQAIGVRESEILDDEMAQSTMGENEMMHQINSGEFHEENPDDDLDGQYTMEEEEGKELEESLPQSSVKYNEEVESPNDLSEGAQKELAQRLKQGLNQEEP